MEAPIKPNDSDCCNSGCNPCIFDVYELELKRYAAKMLPARATIKRNCIQKLKYSKFKVIEIREVMDPLYVYIFEYMGSDDEEEEDLDEKELTFKPGQHFLIKAHSPYENSDFTRPYTPIPYDGLTHQQFAIIVKLYRMGDMCRYLRRLQIGATTIWRGPYGNYTINYAAKHLLCIAQGTGIAPFYAILRKMLQNEDCETIIKLFFCCGNANEIPLRDEIYGLCSHWNFTCDIFLSASDDLQLKYNEVVHERRLERCDIIAYIEGKDDLSIAVCGNSVFNTAMSQHIGECGFDLDKMHLL